jgi:uncharacterized protein (DUF983 family)
MSAATGSRNWRQAMKRGFSGKCPHCGEGKLFRAFLKPVTACQACGEAFAEKHRADDLPAYIVIFIVGHLTIPLFLYADSDVHWPIWLHMAIWPSLVLVLTLLLLQPVKGALIAQQWAMRLHGFDPESEETGSDPAPKAASKA